MLLLFRLDGVDIEVCECEQEQLKISDEFESR